MERNRPTVAEGAAPMTLHAEAAAHSRSPASGANRAVASAPERGSALASQRQSLNDLEASIDHQRERIYALRRGGASTSEAETTLRAMHDVLHERQMVVATLENRRRRGL